MVGQRRLGGVQGQGDQIQSRTRRFEREVQRLRHRFTQRLQAGVQPPRHRLDARHDLQRHAQWLDLRLRVRRPFGQQGSQRQRAPPPRFRLPGRQHRPRQIGSRCHLPHHRLAIAHRKSGQRLGCQRHQRIALAAVGLQRQTCLQHRQPGLGPRADVGLTLQSQRRQQDRLRVQQRPGLYRWAGLATVLGQVRAAVAVQQAQPAQALMALGAGLRLL